MDEKTKEFKAFKDFLLTNKVNAKILGELRKKYESYGTLSCTIKLSNLNLEEITFLERFLDQKITNNDVSFKSKKYIDFFLNTKYHNIDFKEFLDYFFEEIIISKKQLKSRLENETIQFLEGINDKFGENKILSEWVLNQLVSPTNTRLKSIYKENKEKAFSFIEGLAKADNILKKVEDHIRLAYLSAQATSNPHGFDYKTTLGSIFISYLSFKSGDFKIQSSEDRLKLLYSNKILGDSISSYSVGYKLIIEHNGEEILSYKNFNERNEIYLISLHNLTHIDNVKAMSKKVFIIENQMVFSEIIERLNGLDVTVICTSGQMKTASLVLLDYLYKNGYELYYSGDMDPEGLQIAQRFKNRYQNSNLWFFERVYFDKSFKLQDNFQDLAFRLKKMDSLTDKMLVDISKIIKEQKAFSYQENLIELMVEDIVNLTQNV